MNTLHNVLEHLTEPDTIQPAGNHRYLIIKRVMDIILSLLALLVLCIPILILAAMIWLDDPKGSPFFVQVRCGREGQTFKMYKLRTMCIDAESRLSALSAKNEMDGPVFKITDDPRITRVGKLLRKTGVDELPQLLNILLGQMSFVGPRPPLPKEVSQYTQYQMQRLSVKPGLTCLWQIEPKRNDLSFAQWVELDLQYIRTRSLLNDLKIILRTFTSVVHGEGR